MFKPVFSTVACPGWTLSEVAQRADEMGYEAVELRTFGGDSRRFACDPAMTDPTKIREIFGSRGIEILSLATSYRFDEMFGPPVLGPVLWDQEKAVRESKRAIDLAASLECPFVRVYGFMVPDYDTRARTVARIAEKLEMVADHANKTGVRVVLENGGHFGTSREIMEIVKTCNHPLLGVCYHNAVAMLAGEDPVEGLRNIGDRLWVARVQDLVGVKVVEGESGTRTPSELGKGEMKAEEFVRALGSSGFSGPMVYEVDAAWLRGKAAASAEELLASGVKVLFGWGGSESRSKSGMTMTSAHGR